MTTRIGQYLEPPTDRWNMCNTMRSRQVDRLCVSRFQFHHDRGWLGLPAFECLHMRWPSSFSADGQIKSIHSFTYSLATRKPIDSICFRNSNLKSQASSLESRNQNPRRSQSNCWTHSARKKPLSKQLKPLSSSDETRSFPLRPMDSMEPLKHWDSSRIIFQFNSAQLDPDQTK